MTNKQKSTEGVRRYRATHRRIDYYPDPLIVKVIEHHKGKGILGVTLWGVIDQLIAEGHRSLAGKKPA